ncbi:MAG: hypothetical protein LBC56_02900 [Oscillospiraceae bacterium]|jgi:Leucine-rich repeat (LRR) protein|nr:hypothetical protein [Oscillospiraceae bacterium]
MNADRLSQNPSAVKKSSAQKINQTVNTILVVVIVVSISMLVFFTFGLDMFRFNVGGGASKISVSQSEWGGEVPVMRAVADALEISYNEKTPEALLEAVKAVKASQLASITELDLSNEQLTKLPPIMERLAGLKKLNLANNQLTEIPDYLLKKDGLELNIDQNILPASYGNEYQYCLYVLKTQESEYNNLNFDREYSEEDLLSAAKKSLWIIAPNRNGKKIISPLSDSLSFRIEYSDDVDGKKNGIYSYISKNNMIIQEGVIRGEFVLSTAGKDNLNARYPFVLRLTGAVDEPVGAELLAGFPEFAKYLTDTLRINSADELTLPMLASLTAIEIHDKALNTLPPIVSQMSSLMSIDLSGSALTDLPDLSGLASLKRVNLSGNGLAIVPESVYSAPALEELDLSYNQLNKFDFGKIQSANITRINLSHNNLPELPGNDSLYELDWLDLSYNQLFALPEQAAANARSGKWNFEGNLLSPRDGTDQRFLEMIDASIDISFNFSEHYSQSAVFDALLPYVKLSDKSSVSTGMNFDVILSSGENVLSSQYADAQGNILRSGEEIAAFIQPEGADINNTNCKIPIILNFKAKENTSSLAQIQAENPGLNLDGLVRDGAVDPDVFGRIIELCKTPGLFLEFDQAPVLTGKDISLLKNSKLNHVEISFSSGSPEYVWKLYPATLSKELDFSLEISEGGGENSERIKALADQENSFIFSFRHEGELPGELSIRLHTGILFETGEGYLYYYNAKSNTVEYIQKIDITGGAANFSISHCSSYLIVPGLIPNAKGNPGSGLPRLSQLIIIFNIIIFMVFVAGVVSLIQKKRIQSDMPRDKLYARAYANRVKEAEIQNVNQPRPVWSPEETSDDEKIYRSIKFRESGAGFFDSKDYSLEPDDAVIWCNEESLGYRDISNGSDGEGYINIDIHKL